MPKQIRMPPGSPQYLKDLPNNLRVEPYQTTKPKKKANASKSSNADKENADADPKPRARTTKSKKVPEAQQQYSDWRDIELEEVLGEVPCYDNAAGVRRKLKKVLTDETEIPCLDGKKKWTQASMNAEMVDLERKHGAVEYNRNSFGPSARTLGTFLKKTGNMGGGDSPSYYCFPGGLVREDPDKVYVLATPDNIPTWEPRGRQEAHDAMDQDMRDILQDIAAKKSKRTAKVDEGPSSSK